MSERNSPPLPLATIRQSIDQLDDELVELLNRRASLALEVKRAKQNSGTKTYSPEREREIFDRIRKRGEKGPLPEAALARIFGHILSATRSLVGELCVAYCGPQGSPSHAAALKQFGEDVQYVPEVAVSELCSRLESGSAQFGVIPFSRSASVQTAKILETLVHSSVKVIAEVECVESFALLGFQQALSTIRRVISEPYGLFRAADWLRINLPQAERVAIDNTENAINDLLHECASTADGARHDELALLVMDGLVERYLALPQLSGDSPLRVFARGIAEDAGSRFFVLGANASEPTGTDKTSLVCGVKDRAGALRDLLLPFAEEGITLVEIESFPLRRREWDYLFFIDLLGHEKEAAIGKALAKITPWCSLVRVLGSYPLVRA